MNAIQKQISKIINSLIIALATAIGGSILLVIVFVIVLILSGGGAPSMGAGAIMIISALAFFGVLIYAYCLYLSGIKGFGKHLDDVGKSATNLMFWGSLGPVCIGFVGGWLLTIAPILALSFILCGALAGLVLVLLGSFKLPKSSSLNAAGVEGANAIRTAVILNAASALLSVIYCLIMMPLMSDRMSQGVDFIYSPTALFTGVIWVLIAICSSVLSILTIVFAFIGLAKIRRSFAN